MLKNVRVKDKNEAENNAAVCEAVDKVTKELFENGRILLRASGTEPLIRVMVEAKTLEECEGYVDRVIEVMKNNNLLSE